jgi:hypothetical protein
LGYSGGGYQHAIKTRHNSGASSGNAIDFWLWNYGTDAQFTGPSYAVMTVAAGAVGINTFAPAYALDVVGSIRATASAPRVILNGTAGVNGVPGFDLFTYATGSPSVSLNVLDDANYSGHLQFMTRVPGAASNALSERMRLTSSGTVGIGTANPTHTLDVAGDINCAAGGLKQSGNTLMPMGCIILWYGLIATIPGGWALCNGANGTPNLQDCFILGAGNAYAVNGTGGSMNTTLGVANLPGHSHNGSGTTGSENQWHQHNVTGNTGAMNQNSSHNHQQYVGTVDDKNFSNSFGQYPPGDGPGVNANGLYVSTTNTDHLHAFNVNSGNQSVLHQHAFSFTTDNGNSTNGSAFSTMPTYYALAYIMKL